jgi:hypothetical protein
MSQESILTQSRFRYLKWAAALICSSCALTALYAPTGKPMGSSWLGYGLGTVGALLILWLMLYGIRKRSYTSNLGTVRGWLSAHVYLGIALVVVVTLHSGLEFGWNIHTLTYALTMLVTISGVWGVVLYIRQPALMSNALNGSTLQQLTDGILDIDAQSHKLALMVDKEVEGIVTRSAKGAIFQHTWQRFTGHNSACATQAAVNALEELSKERYKELNDLYILQFRRLQQLNRVREYIRLKSWTEIWLLFHVPLAFALLAALIAHVISVFFYW